MTQDKDEIPAERDKREMRFFNLVFFGAYTLCSTMAAAWYFFFREPDNARLLAPLAAVICMLNIGATIDLYLKHRTSSSAFPVLFAFAIAAHVFGVLFYYLGGYVYILFYHPRGWHAL